MPSCVAPVCSKRSLRDATWSVTLLRQRYGARSLSTFQNDADHGRKRSTLGENFRKIDSLCSLEKREVTNFLDVFFFVAGHENCTCVISGSTFTLISVTFLFAVCLLSTKLTNEPSTLMCYLAWWRTLLDSEKILNFWFPVRLWMLTSFLRHVLISNVIIDYLVARRTFFFFRFSGQQRSIRGAQGDKLSREDERAFPALWPRFPRSPQTGLLGIDCQIFRLRGQTTWSWARLNTRFVSDERSEIHEHDAFDVSGPSSVQVTLATWI